MQDKDTVKNKLLVTFILPHPLFGNDSGSIRLLELLKYKPDDFNVTIVENVFETQLKKENLEIFTKLDAKLVSIQFPANKFIMKFMGSRISPLILWIVLPLLIFACGIINRNKLKFLRSQDIIYLFDNRDVYLLPITAKSKVVGTNHGFIYERIPRGRLRELGTKLMGIATLKGAIMHKIKYWHLFPGLIEKIGVTPKKFIILPIGIMTSHYRLNSERGRKTNFLFVGQLKAGKGILTLLEAWRISNLKDSANLIICGWGPLGDTLLKEDILGVQFKGFVSDSELKSIYSMCDVFVYPTKGDNFGFVILEALASGLFVITTEIMRGLFDEFEDKGYLEYLRDDPSIFASVMQRASENLMNIRSNSESVRDLVRKKYDLSIVSAQLFQYFRDITDENNMHLLSNKQLKGDFNYWH